jgi:hypothetical protein
MEELVASGKMTEDERQYKPKVPGRLGKKKDDHSELPLDHPPIDKLSDPIHYIKNYKSELYGFVVLSKAKSKTCKADALRLSRDLAYMVAQHTPGSGNGKLTFEKFQKSGRG